MLQAITFRTSWGWMGILGTDQGVRVIVLPQSSPRRPYMEMQSFSRVPLERAKSRSPGISRILKQAQAELTVYLEGKRNFFYFPIDLSGYTLFQLQVWKVTQSIPYGEVRSYGWVAERLGGGEYARAVGNALGANPLPLIVPCHRVIKKNGAFGGFTAGLSFKPRLLKLERMNFLLDSRRR